MRRTEPYLLVALLIVAVMGGVAALTLRETWAAARGDGVPGTFTPADRHCKSGDNPLRLTPRCTVRGRFAGEDGSARADVVLDGAERLGPPVRALDTGGAAQVYPVGTAAHREPTAWAIAGALAAFALATLVVRRRVRTARVAGATASARLRAELRHDRRAARRARRRR